MDADYVVLGSYSFDGQTFKANAQLLDMKKLHLYPEVQSSGALSQSDRLADNIGVGTAAANGSATRSHAAINS